MSLLDKVGDIIGQQSSRTFNNLGETVSVAIPNITTGLDIADNGLIKGAITDGLNSIVKSGQIKKSAEIINIAGPTVHAAVSQSEADLQFVKLQFIQSKYVANTDDSSKDSKKNLNYDESKVGLVTFLLPFPQDVQVSTSPEWNARAGGILGDLLLNNRIDTDSLLDFSGDKGTVLGDIGSQAATRVKHHLADAVGSGLFGTEGASHFLDGASGKVYNPRDIVLFDGIQHRTFSIQFNFAPTSEDASIALRKFLIDIHEHAVPDIQGPYFTYPDYMEFAIVDKEGDPILDRGSVVVKSLNCNYTPDGVWATFKSGQPVHVQLDVEFQERELPTKKTIKRLFGNIK